MSQQKTSRPKARLPRGFRDRSAGEIAAERALIDTIRAVYESYGFSPLETPAFEYTDALGKFLPDVDRPNEGVFSLKDDDEQWLSLRYDLTAPLARYVAENFQNLPKPFRRYQVGPVWRNEKPGPGRFREFTQFDADTVGSASPAADAELLMMVCDALEALGLKRGEYVIKINSRKTLDAILEIAKIDQSKRGTVMRAIDKMDRLGRDGVRLLLGEGRKDESGDFAKGAGLSNDQIDTVLAYVVSPDDDTKATYGTSDAYGKGAMEVVGIQHIVRNADYESDRICIDRSIIRGLDYYTGPVFEAQLTFPVTNEAGETVVFGSVAGGGRYDDLVARFTGQQVPATGISIGVSRLLSALNNRNQSLLSPLVMVLPMSFLPGNLAAEDAAGRGFVIAAELRAAGLRAESYVGTKKVPDQLKYADKRGAALVVMEGDDERNRNPPQITIKDLKRGAEVSKSVESRAEWVGARAGQETVDRGKLVEKVCEMLARKG